MRILFSIILISFLTNFAFGKTYYVATTGTSTNNGLSLDTPLPLITNAISLASAGDTILVRGGTYSHSATVTISKSGTDTTYIQMFAYGDEKPILDFTNTASGKQGIKLTGSYWHIKGFNIEYAGDNGMIISAGSYNIIELCKFHDNEDSGLQIGNGAHDNKVINCDSYFNADPSDYGDADGFACKLDVGTNNYFYGCRSWLNVDDGWDGYMRGADDVSTVLENCWTWRNGYFKDGTDAGTNANGNGFKMGGSDDKTLKHNFTLRNCLTFDNKAKGFDQNNNKGTMLIYNGTSFRNGTYNYSIPSTLATGKTAEIYNCAMYSGSNNLGSFVVQGINSWNGNFTVTADDFQSVDTTGISGPRQADGSLPDLKFMKLAAGSDLIDAGANVGLSYSGNSPDLGAFEYTEGNGVNNLSTQSQSKLNLKTYYNQQDGELIARFNLDGEQTISWMVYDIQGRVVIGLHQYNGEKGQNYFTVKNPLLTDGVYLFRLTSNTGGQSTRFLVNR